MQEQRNLRETNVYILRFSKQNLWKSMPSTRFPNASGSNEVNPGSQILLTTEQQGLFSRSQIIQMTQNIQEIPDSRVSVKVSIVDGLDQLFGDLDDFLFACCRKQKKQVKIKVTNNMSWTKGGKLVQSFKYNQTNALAKAAITPHKAVTLFYRIN